MDRTRALASVEKAHFGKCLSQLREHYSAWPTDPGKEQYLIAFSYYEGCSERYQCCEDLLKECAPLALDKTLASEFVFGMVYVVDL